MNEYNCIKEALDMDADEYLETFRVIKDEYEVQILEDKLKSVSKELGKYHVKTYPVIDLGRSDN